MALGTSGKESLSCTEGIAGESVSTTLRTTHSRGTSHRESPQYCETELQKTTVDKKTNTHL